MRVRKVSLSKEVFGSLDVSETRAVGVYGPKRIKGNGISDEAIRDVLENPIGMEPLRIRARGCKNIVIITDDNTRSTPVRRIIPHVLKHLEDARVQKNAIRFLIGSGTHRPMSDYEIDHKFGRNISREYKIFNHAWNDNDHLISLGKNELGFEVVVNKMVKEADLIISIGSIVPHATTGFSGGAKTAMTGIAGESTIESTHWKALDYSMSDILGKYPNPLLAAMYKLGRQIDLGMIINTILFDGDKIYGMVAGDLEAAHRKGIEMCREVYGLSISEMADVVIAEAYPADINLRQSIKALCAADLVCRSEGVIILAAECCEGIARQFPKFIERGFKDPETLYNDVQNGEFKQKLMAYTLVAVGRIMSKRRATILISPYIKKSESEQMGFTYAKDLQQAVEKAEELVGRDSKIIMLREASVISPILDQ